MARAVSGALAETDLEQALRHLTRALQECLGDSDAARRPGALRAEERDYRVAGVFVITPDGQYNMLVASVGFPEEQRRLAIPVGWSHPGRVVKTQEPLLLENTDDHRSFQQFLKTSRMGSALYAPVFDRGRMVGQIVAAAQARWTYDPGDLDRLMMAADAAGLVWRLTAGDRWLARDYPAEDLWRAEERVPASAEGSRDG